MASFQTQIQKFANERLVPRGFSRLSKTSFERETNGIRQCIEFPRHRDRFTATVLWSISVSPLPTAGYQFSRRFGRFSVGRDIWFSTKDELDKGLNRIGDILDQHVMPFLEKFRSVQAILNGVDAGELEAWEAFGADEGWRHFFLGFCYRHVGDRENAMKAFRKFLESDADEDDQLEWVVDRRRIVQAAMAES